MRHLIAAVRTKNVSHSGYMLAIFCLHVMVVRRKSAFFNENMSFHAGRSVLA
jgi:hypothetical protein